MISSDIRKDFPLFRNNPDIAYLDNAATTQKPQSVLDAVRIIMNMITPIRLEVSMI